MENELENQITRTAKEEGGKCRSEIRQVAYYEDLSVAETQARINAVLAGKQHFCINLSDKYYKNEERPYIIFNAVFNALRGRKDLKSLAIQVDNRSVHNKSEFMERLLSILNENLEILEIPYLIFDRNSFSTDHIEPLVQKIFNKKIGIFSLVGDPIDKEKVETLSRYLKNMDIDLLSIDDASLGNEGALHLTQNLPKNIKILSLENNNIDKLSIKLILENLSKTFVSFVDLSGNKLYDRRLDDVMATLKSSPIDGDKLINILLSTSIDIRECTEIITSSIKSSPIDFYNLKDELMPLFLLKADDVREILKSTSINMLYLKRCGLLKNKSEFEGMLNKHLKVIDCQFGIGW